MLSSASRLLNSSALPFATKHSSAPPPATATVTFFISVNIPLPLPSTMTAHSPFLAASSAILFASVSFTDILFSSLEVLPWTLPRYLRREPNSYFSKRSTASGVYTPVISISSAVTSSGMSVLMVTRV